MKIASIPSLHKDVFLMLSFFYILFSPSVCAQIPQGIPKEMGPVDFSSPANIVIYIVLPIIVLVAFFFWRAAVRKKKKKEEEERIAEERFRKEYIVPDDSLRADAAGVRHFVFISVPPVTPDHPIQRAKRAVEERLRHSTMSWTVLRALNFIEVWLSPGFGFDPAHGKARVLGDGEQPVSWVSLHDVARFAVAAASCERFSLQTVLLGGPDALSYHQVIEIFQELGSPSVTVEHVSEAALAAQLASASTPLEETYAAIMLSTARGLVADPGPALELLPGRLSTVREYAQQLLEQTKTQDGD